MKNDLLMEDMDLSFNPPVMAVINTPQGLPPIRDWTATEQQVNHFVLSPLSFYQDVPCQHIYIKHAWLSVSPLPP